MQVITKTSRGDFAVGSKREDIYFFNLESKNSSEESLEYQNLGYISDRIIDIFGKEELFSCIIEAKNDIFYVFAVQGIFIV